MESPRQPSENMTTSTNIFVYGSLREGERLHHFLQSCPRIGEVKLSKPKYTLIDLGPYPGLRREGTTSIVGEVYAVNPATLALLDEIEGSYDRLPIELEDGTIAEAYFMKNRSWRSEYTGNPLNVVPSGDWVYHYARKRQAWISANLENS